MERLPKARGPHSIRPWKQPTTLPSEIAVAVRAALEEQGIGADVVSMPSMGLFRAQDADYKADLLPADVLKVSIVAGTTWGWEGIVGNDGLSIGIDTFGESAPGEEVMKEYGFSVENVVNKAKALLKH